MNKQLPFLDSLVIKNNKLEVVIYRKTTIIIQINLHGRLKSLHANRLVNPLFNESQFGRELKYIKDVRIYGYSATDVN